MTTDRNGIFFVRLLEVAPDGRTCCIQIGSHDDPLLGRKIVIPDHKLYFVPVETEEEAAYLTAFLNAPIIARAISAYAAQLSLGTSVVEYPKIPPFDAVDRRHRRLAQLAQEIVHSGQPPTEEQLAELDRLVQAMLGLA